MTAPSAGVQDPGTTPDSGQTKRCVLITGASRGIGAAVARALLMRGHEVIGLSRQAPRTDSKLQAMHWRSVDLADLKVTTTSVQALLKKPPGGLPIDTLILNAGRGDIGSLENFSAAQITDSLLFNLASPLVVARGCLPTLRRRSRSDIVFIGSESAVRGGRFGSLYSAAKFGLRGAAQALREECAAANCHVGIVQPGMVRTDFFDGLTFQPGPEGQHALQAEDVAAAVLSMIEAPDHALIDEISLKPRQHVVQKKPTI